MNFVERKNTTFRTLSILFNIVAIIAMITSFVYVVRNKPGELMLSIIGLILAICFVLMEIILLFLGKKKEPALKNIAFNENDTINKFPAIVVGVGTAFSIGLLTLAIVIFNQKDAIDTKCNMTVIGVIALYLLLNCIIYFIFLIMYKKRPLKLEDLIK